MISKMSLLLGLVFLSSMASAANECPNLNAPNRDQVLMRLFQEVKPDPTDPKTGPKQDLIFTCLEKLIKKTRSELAGKSPDLETMKRLVLWTVKMYQYNNDEYAGELVYELGQKIFRPNLKLANIALQQLQEEKILTKADAQDFNEGIGTSR